jgi:hypothetical protein
MYYARGENPAKTFEKYMLENAVTIESVGGSGNKKFTPIDLGIAMMNNYVKKYAKERFTVVATEQEIARRVPKPYDFVGKLPERAKHFYVATRVDTVIFEEFTHRHWVLEHKTFTKFNPGQMEMNAQFAIEAFVANGWLRQFGDLRVAGVIYNGLRKAADESPTTKLFERVPIHVNSEQISQVLRRVFWRLMEITDPDAHIFPEPSNMKCMYCAFKQPCTELLRGGDYQFLLDTLYTRSESEDWATEDNSLE